MMFKQSTFWPIPDHPNPSITASEQEDNTMRWLLGIVGTLASFAAAFVGGALYIKAHGWPMDEALLTAAQQATLDTVRWVCGGATYLGLLVLTWGRLNRQAMTDGIVFIGPQQGRPKDSLAKKVVYCVALFLFVVILMHIYHAMIGQ